MNAKYEASTSNGSKFKANIKVDSRQTDRRTDKQTNKQTNRQDKTICPDHSIRVSKGILSEQYKQELKASNRKVMSLQYDSLSEGKRQKCKEMYPNWQVYTCKTV